MHGNITPTSSQAAVHHHHVLLLLLRLWVWSLERGIWGERSSSRKGSWPFQEYRIFLGLQENRPASHLSWAVTGYPVEAGAGWVLLHLEKQWRLATGSSRTEPTAPPHLPFKQGGWILPLLIASHLCSSCENLIKKGWTYFSGLEFIAYIVHHLEIFTLTKNKNRFSIMCVCVCFFFLERI